MPVSFKLILIVTLIPVAGIVAALVASKLPSRRPDQ